MGWIGSAALLAPKWLPVFWFFSIAMGAEYLSWNPLLLLPSLFWVYYFSLSQCVFRPYPNISQKWNWRKKIWEIAIIWVRSRWLRQRHSSFWFIVVDRIFVTHRSKKHLWIMRCRLFIVSDMWQKCDSSIIHTCVCDLYHQWISVTRDVGNHAHV